jgi:hypothetical protein
VAPPSLVVEASPATDPSPLPESPPLPDPAPLLPEAAPPLLLPPLPLLPLPLLPPLLEEDAPPLDCMEVSMVPSFEPPPSPVVSVELGLPQPTVPRTVARSATFTNVRSGIMAMKAAPSGGPRRSTRIPPLSTLP